MKKENKGLLYYIKADYGDETNELVLAIRKSVNEAFIKSGFGKSTEEIGLNSKGQERKGYNEILEKRLDD